MFDLLRNFYEAKSHMFLQLANFYGRAVPRAQTGVPDPGGGGGLASELCCGAINMVRTCERVVLRCSIGRWRDRRGW